MGNRLRTEFRKALLQTGPDGTNELRSLMAFDRKVFPSDYFLREDWEHYEPWWMIVDSRKVGCCAFEKNVDFQGDIREDGLNPPMARSLYIGTTGILPAYQRCGLGQLMKSWQIAYARRHGFSRIVSNTRKRNAAMIALNKKFGFHVLRTTPRYYGDPVDATVVMELILPE